MGLCAPESILCVQQASEARSGGGEGKGRGGRGGGAGENGRGGKAEAVACVEVRNP